MFKGNNLFELLKFGPVSGENKEASKWIPFKLEGLEIDTKIIDENITVFDQEKKQIVYSFKRNERDYASYLLNLTIVEDSVQSSKIVFKNSRARVLPLKICESNRIVFLLQAKDSVGGSLEALPDVFVLDEFEDKKITTKVISSRFNSLTSNSYSPLNFSYQIGCDKVVLENDIYKSINRGATPET